MINPDYSNLDYFIIGNGPVDEEFGKGIDDADEVIRFNNYKTKGFERLVGSKTTLWATNMYHDVRLPNDFESYNRAYAVMPINWPDWEPKTNKELWRVLSRKQSTEFNCISTVSYLELHSHVPNPSAGLCFLWEVWIRSGIPLERERILGFDGFQVKNGTYHLTDEKSYTTHNGFLEMQMVQVMCQQSYTGWWSQDQ